MQRPLYFDYAATTPLDPRVLDTLQRYLTLEGEFGNPASSGHAYGLRAKEAVERARAQVASLIQAFPSEIVWTSGATESNNLAIKGVCEFYERRGRHVITVSTEHKAVLDTCRALEQRGFSVTYLAPKATGLLDLEALAAAISKETVLISVMHVNNETGVVQDIASIGQIARRAGVFFHVDAAQSAGKLPIDVNALNIDLLSMSGHKCYGPKGIGALYVRGKPAVRLQAQTHGGGQEMGLRSGTLATHQIAAMGEAFALAAADLAGESQRISGLRDRLWVGLSKISGVHLNSYLDQCAPGHLNVSFAGVHGEALILALQELAVSAGSACSSGSRTGSYVLKAMGLSDELANSAIRFTLGRFTTEAEVDAAIDRVAVQVSRLQAISSGAKRGGLFE